MNAETLQSELADSGELMVTVDGFGDPFELHIHDTEIGDETVRLELADGTLEFATESVTGFWKHYHSLSDYGLD